MIAPLRGHELDRKNVHVLDTIRLSSVPCVNRFTCQVKRICRPMEDVDNSKCSVVLSDLESCSVALDLDLALDLVSDDMPGVFD